MADLALLVQWLYGERVGSYVNNRAQLEPVSGVRRPHRLPVLHGLPPVSTGTRLCKGEGQKQEAEEHT